MKQVPARILRLRQDLSRRELLTLSGKAVVARAFGGRVLGTDWRPALQPDDCTSALPDPPSLVKSFRAPEHQTACIVDHEPKVGLFFTVSATLDPTQASYANYEYRQYVSGYVCCRTPPDGSWEAVPLNLRGNKILSPSQYQEDGFANGTAFGYRDPKYVCCDDDFGPKGTSRQEGWLYSLADFPGLAAAPGIEYQIKLDFCLRLVDASVVEPRTVSIGRVKVRCCGILPMTRVCVLPDDPPCPLHWAPSKGENREFLVTTLKPMGDYFVRIVVDLEHDYTLVRVAVVKPNTAPRIDRSALHLHLLDGNNGEIPALPVPACSPLLASNMICEVNSASTTAQASFLFAPTKKVQSAVVTLPDRSVNFESADFI